MTSEEDQKKAILPFLQRADEIEKVEPKMAYYCRMYAVDTGISFGRDRSPKIEGVVRALITKLEKDKRQANLADEDSEYCRTFAETVFQRADRVDRAGRADKSTAMTFYAASIFIEVLSQFGDLPVDLLDIQKYAAWKAADISRALREGRQPTPGSAQVPPFAEELIQGNNNGEEGGHSTEREFEFPAVPGSRKDDARGADDPGFPTIPRDAGGAADMGFPSVPKAGLASGPSNASTDAGYAADYAAAAALSGSLSDDSSTADGQPPRFARGQKVLYDSFEQPLPVQGTVAKIDRADAGGWKYTVALAERIVSVLEHILAPQFEAGDSVIYTPDGGGASLTASVVLTDASHWRPTYQIRTQDGQLLTTTDDTLLSFAPAAARKSASPTQSRPEATPARAHPPQPPAAARPSPPSGASQGHGSQSAGHTQPAPPASAPSAPQYSATQYSAAPSAQPASTRWAVPAAVPGFQPALSAVTEAQKHAKYAVSALGFEDVKSAVKNLTDALKLLTEP